MSRHASNQAGGLEVQMFNVYEAFGLSRRSIRAAFDTFEEACAYVKAIKPIDFEIDEDHPGCADALMPGGMIYVIEPAK